MAGICTCAGAAKLRGPTRSCAGPSTSTSHRPAVVPVLTFEAPDMYLRPTCTDPARQSAMAARARRLITGHQDAPGPSPGSDASHSAARTRSPSARRAAAHTAAPGPPRAKARGPGTPGTAATGDPARTTPSPARMATGGQLPPDRPARDAARWWRAAHPAALRHPPHQCPGPGTPATNNRATVKLSRTAAAISAPPVPIRPTRMTPRRTDTPGIHARPGSTPPAGTRRRRGPSVPPLRCVLFVEPVPPVPPVTVKVSSGSAASPPALAMTGTPPPVTMVAWPVPPTRS